MATVTVTKRGQTTIPMKLRKKYGIKDGAVLDVEDTGSGILLKKAKSTLDLLGTGRRSQKEVFALLDKMREEESSSPGKVDWHSIRGVLKGTQKNSVNLQHTIGRKLIDPHRH